MSVPAAIDLWQWARFEHCQEPLMELVPSQLLAVRYSGNPVAGFCDEIVESSQLASGWREECMEVDAVHQKGARRRAWEYICGWGRRPPTR